MKNQESKSITNLIDDFIKKIKAAAAECECDDIAVDHYLSQPLNAKKATEGELVRTEEKLACSIPVELRNYYINEANGTETDEEKYAVDNETLDIFSHQKIMGIYDYFKFYWENEDVGMDEILECLSEDEISFIEKNNKEFFVCVVNWTGNFLETFVFDKEGNYYQFRFDQDETIDVYIKEMINGSEHMQKDKSLIKLLKDIEIEIDID